MELHSSKIEEIEERKRRKRRALSRMLIISFILLFIKSAVR